MDYTHVVPFKPLGGPLVLENFPHLASSPAIAFVFLALAFPVLLIPAFPIPAGSSTFWSLSGNEMVQALLFYVDRWVTR